MYEHIWGVAEGRRRALTSLPTEPGLRLPPHRFQATLRRRLRLPLPVTEERCTCGEPLDALGDHRAACPTSGLLRLRAGPVEQAWGRVLREAGGKVRDNVPLWAMGLEQPVPRTDRRAIELVALGLPLYHGLPLACDATLASPLHANGEARPRAAEHPGEALARREDDKLERYPELAASARARLVVLAGEVGGRWSATAAWLLQRLAAAKAAEAPWPLRRGTALALQRRWWGLLASAAQDALA